MTGVIKTGSAHRAPLLIAGLFAASTVPLPASAQTAGGVQQLASVNATASHYKVNIGDELDVFVWGEERMQRSVRVQPDGTLAFPLAGTITAKGRNVSDIAAEIRERIAVNYRSAPPDVTVSVRDATEMQFYVIGKVRTPGSYTSGSAINILQALSMAGGAAEFADVKNAVILRQQADGSQIVEPVKLHTVLKGNRALSAGALTNALPTLSSGDILVVP